MIKLINSKPTGTIVMLVAESQNDWECLEMLYNEGICFGAYMLYHFREDKTKSLPLHNWLIKNFPLCHGIMQISVVKGFANKPNEGK